jgi:hypothetical protein
MCCVLFWQDVSTCPYQMISVLVAMDRAGLLHVPLQHLVHAPTGIGRTSTSRTIHTIPR